MTDTQFGPEQVGTIAGTVAGQIARERDRYREQLAEAREKLAAAEHFADIWRDTLPELPDAYMCTYTCPEANAAADLYRALGDEDTAICILANHAHYDEDGDEHYGYKPPAKGAPAAASCPDSGTCSHAGVSAEGAGEQAR